MVSEALQVLDQLYIPVRRSTFNQRLLSWMTQINAEIIVPTIKQTLKVYEDSHGFRWQSKKTRTAQDRVLRDYRNSISLFLKSSGVDAIQLPSGDIGDINDAYVFPADEELLIKYTVQFLILWTNTVGTHQKPRLASLFKARLCLWIWLSQGRLEIPQIPSKSLFFRRTTEAIKLLNSKGSIDRFVKDKVYLGLPELVQMLEYDMTTGKSIAVIEQHAAAWLFGYLCGVRPAALTCDAQSDGSISNLTWKQVSIFRELESDGHWKGKFLLDVTFRRVKQPNNSKAERSTIRMIIGSPETNTTLSLPHRVLVILLRRSLLAAHTSVKSLMESREYEIEIKKDAADLPFLFATSQHGLRDLDTTKPASSKSLTRYQALRTLWLGYPSGATFYAWRRKFGSQLARSAGLEVTKRAMDHAPMSNVYQVHYDQGLYDFNPSRRLIDGVSDIGSTVMEDHESPAVHRAILLRQCSQREGIIATFLNKHPLVIAAMKTGNSKEIQKVRTRMRRIILAALLQNERELQQKAITTDELRARISQLSDPTTFQQKINDTIHEISEALQAEDGIVDNLSSESAEDFRDIEAEVSNDEASPDTPLTRNITEISDEDRAEPAQDLITEFMVMMQILLDYSPEPSPGTVLTCPQCESNPCRSDEEKTKDWRSRASLQKHLLSKSHCGLEEFRVQAEYAASTSPAIDCPYACPYGCRLAFTNFELLQRHIQEPSAGDLTALTEEHEARKKEDGWQEPGFFGTTKPAKRKPSKQHSPEPQQDRPEVIPACTHRLLVGREHLLESETPGQALNLLFGEQMRQSGGSGDFFQGRQFTLMREGERDSQELLVKHSNAIER